MKKKTDNLSFSHKDQTELSHATFDKGMAMQASMQLARQHVTQAATQHATQENQMGSSWPALGSTSTNPYARTIPGNFYHYNKPGHRFKVYPER